MLRSIALALLLASPLCAQWIPFPVRTYPGSSAGVGGPFTFKITWEGKPALLLVGEYAGQGQGPAFVHYDAQFPTMPGYPIATPVFRLAAAHFGDRRPCAVQPWSHLGHSGNTAEVHLHIDDLNPVLSFGNLRPDGTLTWQPGFGLGQRIAFDRWVWGSHNKVYFAGSYCTAMSATNFSNCPGPSSAQFMALVLVIEGIVW